MILPVLARLTLAVSAASLMLGGTMSAATADQHEPAWAQGRSAEMAGGLSPFMVGFHDPRENSFSGRPVDVLQMPDGALLVADEQNGAIYRISYQTPDYSE